MFVQGREEKYIGPTRTCEIPCPEGTTVGQIPKACRVTGKLPVQALLLHIADPPVAISRAIKEHVKLLQASEVAYPEFMSFQEIAKACRIIGKSPVELIIAEVAKPPLAAFWVIEEQFAAPRTCKRAY